MQESYSQSRYKIDMFAELFSASLWSGIFASVLSLLVIISVSMPIIRRNVLQGTAVDFSQSATGTPLATLERQAEQLGQSHVAATLSLFLFWGIVGVVAYLFVMGVKNIIGGAVELDDELHYVHTDRKELISTALTRFGVRLMAAVVWLLYAWVFAHLLVPYVVAAAGTAAGEFPAGLSFAYYLLSFVVMWFSLHMHVIFARLLALRVRVFSDAPTD